MCHYNRNTHNITFCIFLCRTLSNFYKIMKYKSIDPRRNIMSKRRGIFTENFTIFFTNAAKIANVSEFKFDIF